MRADLALPWQTQANMTQPAEDPDLIHRMQAGDDDAVCDLYAQYGQRLYAYALRLTHDPVGTVKSRLSYARDHLRGVLAHTEER